MKPSDLISKVILSLSAIVTICTLGWLMHYSYYGIDLTDESFYLVWMSNPFNYSASPSQFGFIYHPLYELLNGNIAALRQANVLISFALAWAMGHVFLKTVFESQGLGSGHRDIISAAFATSSLMCLTSSGCWLPTPNYNSLAFQALLIAGIGMLLAEKKICRVSIAGWLLMGIGGWLAFMAKPTTAVALVLCSGFYILAAGKFNVRLLVISLAVAAGLLVLSAFVIDGSMSVFIDRLKGGKDCVQLTRDGYSLARWLRWDIVNFGGSETPGLIAATVLIFFAAYFFQSEKKALAYGGTIFLIAAALFALAIIFGFVYRVFDAVQSQGLLLWSVPFAAILTGLAIYRFRGLVQISRRQWVLALSFLVFPYAYACGTSRNYWENGTNVAIFWIFSGLVLLCSIASVRKLTAALLSLGLATQLTTVVLVHASMETPQRQAQRLFMNNYKLELGRPGSTLLISKGLGRYITEAMDLAKKAGFKKETPMIDLSGQSPGILYALGADSIGQPWMIGGYPGSEKRAVAMLKRVSCEDLSRAWLLNEPEGPRAISPEILSSFGANLAKDFMKVATFKTARGAGGYVEAREQQLLKPVRSVDDAMAACVASRAAKQ
jgi:hypothetical protein